MSTVAHTIAEFTNLFRGRATALTAPARAPRLVRPPGIVRRETASRPPPRVLILSASAGAGHVRAAEAIELALRETHPDALIVNRDVLSLTNAPFRYLYGRLYFDIIAHAPHLIGFLYDRLDKPVKWRRLDRLRARLQRMIHLRRAVELIESHPWDVVINTHFIGAEIIATLKHERRIDVPQVTVTTDFYAHQMWVTEHVDRYYAASEEAAVNLASRVPAGSVEVTGIPVHPVFSQPHDPAACRERHGLSADRPVVLQLSGGLGLGPIEQVHRELLSSERPLHVVVAAGKNEHARRRLEQIPIPPQHRRTVLGFTNKMHELLTAADVVVSKPGGLTTSECLVTGTPMLVIDPIPGQETRNSDYLLEHGAAMKINALASLRFKLESLLSDPHRLSQMRRNARRIGKPRAAFDVAARSLELARSSSFRC